MGFACIDPENNILITHKYRINKILESKLTKSLHKINEYWEIILSADCLIIDSRPIFSTKTTYTLNNELGIKKDHSHITGRSGFDLVWFNGSFDDIDHFARWSGIPIIIMYSWKEDEYKKCIYNELYTSPSANTSIPNVYYAKVNDTYVCHVNDLQRTLNLIGINQSHNVLVSVHCYAYPNIIKELRNFYAKPRPKKTKISQTNRSQ